MQTSPSNSDTLWKFSDLAEFLKVSESKLRHDVLEGRIPCIRIGKAVRFDKQQIEKHFNIEIRKENEFKNEEEKPSVKPSFNRGPRKDFITDIITWLKEKSTLLPYSEIDIRLIIHDGKIKRMERTIVEKIQEL